MDEIVKAAADAPNSMRKIEVKKIIKEECKKARSLWEEVFWEDSFAFTEYYFNDKAPLNIGYVCGEQPYKAMMFRTPYKVQIGEKQRELSYLVGVATRKEYRHQGYMTALLKHSFEEMYQEKQPFTFLMPANPAIYEPFDFRYIYERDVYHLTISEKQFQDLERKIKKAEKGMPQEETEVVFKAAEHTVTNWEEEFCNLQGLYPVSTFIEEMPGVPIMKLLADFANEYLKSHFHIYIARDEAYYEMQWKESKAQNGDIYVLIDSGVIQGFFLYAKEGETVFIQEVLEKKEGIFTFLKKEDEKKPVIMARIIHLEEMLKLVCGKNTKTLLIEIKDEILMQNNGFYRWKITPSGSQAERWTGEQAPEISMNIGELTSHILTGVFINEIV